MSVIMEENSRAGMGAPIQYRELTPEEKKEAEEMAERAAKIPYI
ncbi:MAG TPA: hypothetical protein O0X70_05380 [Methanocorpusculum sp.]|nr:hypothetical protein [Methanocorpusculum sp.]